MTSQTTNNFLPEARARAVRIRAPCRARPVGVSPCRGSLVEKSLQMRGFRHLLSVEDHNPHDRQDYIAGGRRFC